MKPVKKRRISTIEKRHAEVLHLNKEYKDGKLKTRKNKLRSKDTLKHTLEILVKELLPIAVKRYKNGTEKQTSYSVTAIISEIRSLIDQLDTSVDAVLIIKNLNDTVTNALKIYVSKLSNSLLQTKEQLPLKISDSAQRREVQRIIDDILKLYQSSTITLIGDMENRITVSVNSTMKGKKKK